MNKLETRLGELVLKNPLMTASGTAGHGDELSKVNNFHFEKLGAFVTKGVTIEGKKGNPSHRIVEVAGGLINSIGLQNRGLKYFMEKELPTLEKYNIPIIVNVCANSMSEFENLCEDLIKYKSSEIINGVEINVSCPNITAGGLSLGTDSLNVELIVSVVKHIMRNKLVITKLTPNVTDIVEIAEAAISGGTDALTMINTVRGCAVDVSSRSFILGKKFGGLSGPAIKPIGLLAVYECFNKIDRCKNREIPIIGVGGITNYIDILEYIMVGASAVQIGTGFLSNWNIFNAILKDLEDYLDIKSETISELIGTIC